MPEAGEQKSGEARHADRSEASEGPGIRTAARLAPLRLCGLRGWWGLVEHVERIPADVAGDNRGRAVKPPRPAPEIDRRPVLRRVRAPLDFCGGHHCRKVGRREGHGDATLVQRFHGTTPIKDQPAPARRLTEGPGQYEWFHGIAVLVQRFHETTHMVPVRVIAFEPNCPWLDGTLLVRPEPGSKKIKQAF